MRQSDSLESGGRLEYGYRPNKDECASNREGVDGQNPGSHCQNTSAKRGQETLKTPAFVPGAARGSCILCVSARFRTCTVRIVNSASALTIFRGALVWKREALHKIRHRRDSVCFSLVN